MNLALPLFTKLSRVNSRCDFLCSLELLIRSGTRQPFMVGSLTDSSMSMNETFHVADPISFSFAAWAHLILYGEEATKQAQKEGEEAAAAYEREQQDIAAGKLPEVSPRQKKKKPPAKKPEKGDATGADAKTGADGAASKAAEPAPKKRKSVKEVTGAAPEKKTKTNTKACKLEKEAIGSTVAKGVTKVTAVLSVRLV